MTDREIEKRMTNKEIQESVDRAFRQMDAERREQARKSSADSARERMIRRQTTDKANSKSTNTGMSKPPLWSGWN